MRVSSAPEYDPRRDENPLLEVEEVVLLLGVGVPASVVVVLIDVLEVVPLDNVVFPVPSCCNTKLVPFREKS
jgi:hypothetical protein